MSQDLEDTDLAGDSLDIGLLDDLLLLQRLDGHLHARVNVHPQTHLAECALADALP